MYKLIAIAGTFDRLHKGHRFFITEAFKLGEKVMIGLTSDEYARRKFSIRVPSGRFQFSNKIQIQNFQMRKKELEEFLKQEGLSERAEITRIDDVYGPAIRRTGGEIEALVVTEETYEGGLKVNKKRSGVRLKALKLLKIPMILAEDEKRIASTRIRMGEIDRWGRVFHKIFNFQFSIFKISENLRQELKKPLGLLIKGNPSNLNDVAEELKKAVGRTKSPLISTVGDEATKVCNEAGIAINLAIVDYKVNRMKKYSSLKELGIINQKAGLQKVDNPPGHITKELVKEVKKAYMGIIGDNGQRIIEVNGEEDLAGVPAVLLAPLGTIVLYGQPGEGVVLVEVTEEKKAALLKSMGKNI